MKYFFVIMLSIISINSVAAKDTKKISTNFCEDAKKMEEFQAILAAQILIIFALFWNILINFTDIL